MPVIRGEASSFDELESVLSQYVLDKGDVIELEISYLAEAPFWQSIDVARIRDELYNAVVQELSSHPNIKYNVSVAVSPERIVPKPTPPFFYRQVEFRVFVRGEADPALAIVVAIAIAVAVSIVAVSYALSVYFQHASYSLYIRALEEGLPAQPPAQALPDVLGGIGGLVLLAIAGLIVLELVRRK